MAKTKRVVLVVLSDTHGGHKLGLMNPETKPVEGFMPAPDDVNLLLWKIHMDGFKEVKSFAGKDEIVLLHLGELCQGNGKQYEAVSHRISDQIHIAKWNLMPWLELPNVKVCRLVVGTAFHEFDDASASVLVGEPLKERYPKKDIKVVFHGCAKIQNVNIDYAHKGPHPGGREWLKGNTARYYLRDRMWKELSMGNEPPNLYLRGHYHNVVNEVLGLWWNEKQYYESRVVVCPSLCLLDSYARSATGSAPFVRNGIVYFEIIEGVLSKPNFATEVNDVRTIEKM